MRRSALILTLVALAAPAAAHAQAPTLRAKLTACADRTASFTGSMPKIRGTVRMSMRFDLVAGTTPVKAPGLSVWQKSRVASASGFVFTQRVQGLAAPGTYKATVTFRWYGPHGRVLRTTSRTTAACVLPDPRPDLQAGLLAATPGPQPGQASYSLVVRNVGRGATGPFDVAFGPQSQPVDSLAPGATWTVTFVAASCAPGSTVRFDLDAAGAVDEVNEDDDTVTKACPFVA